MKTPVLTQAASHIRIHHANRSKLSALDSLAEVYIALCQKYTEYFCTEVQPDKFATPVFPTSLSQRWQRVAIQQAAGIAQSWHTNHDKAYAEFLKRQTWHNSLPMSLQGKHKVPIWNKWKLPELKQTRIQANTNVILTLADKDINEDILKLETSQKGVFDFWLIISIIQKHKPIYLPIKLSNYHKTLLHEKTLNTSITLNRRKDGSWWLTLTLNQSIAETDFQPSRPHVAADIGIANFLTSSTGKHYGTFHSNMAHRFQLDREKRQRKAKLWACLKKKGVDKLPSTTSISGQRLMRHIKQEINGAVNLFFNDHKGHDISPRPTDVPVSGVWTYDSRR